jgi:hypothetical protein
VRKSRFNWVLPTYMWLVLGYLFLPVLVVILFSFNDITRGFNVVWQGFTFVIDGSQSRYRGGARHCGDRLPRLSPPSWTLIAPAQPLYPAGGHQRFCSSPWRREVVLSLSPLSSLRDYRFWIRIAHVFFINLMPSCCGIDRRI